MVKKKKKEEKIVREDLGPPIRKVGRYGQTDGRKGGASAQYHLISFLRVSLYAYGAWRARRSAIKVISVPN